MLDISKGAVRAVENRGVRDSVLHESSRVDVEDLRQTEAVRPTCGGRQPRRGGRYLGS